MASGKNLGGVLLEQSIKELLYQGGNKAIAVKRLEKVVEEGILEFQSEMTTIRRTHHRNLVQLLGFRIEGSKRLLVYEFMSNGSLADLLFKTSVHPTWKERVRFALDVARGLFFLHKECGVHIIHCNLKPQNILLDDTLTAKISDFGFARLLMPKKATIPDQGIETERKRSSFALDQWQKNALISVNKSDIYSFWIVLLEIICFMAGDLNKVVELDEDVNMRTLERMVKVSMWCIQLMIRIYVPR
ncbi:hypothetical protein TIFTF001_031719 [Ficus carica]|uniref:non-specific serine/threonine protein kinase n=1 Tax=Ficus carica TaxID=3494 RepID=A0AA88DW11_FICCA|nr:hypothetical protein TIFTF001_031719 [Ficus carica]